MIEYRFRVPNAVAFTLYSYSKALEYPFRVPTAGLHKSLQIRKYSSDSVKFCLQYMLIVTYILR
jgi:hypothetical protein